VTAVLEAERLYRFYHAGDSIGHLDVTANVRMAQRLAGSRERTAVATILDALGLGARARALPRELSGGEIARAGLAVALANDPDLLLCDEPTGELDGATAHRVLSLLRERATKGSAVVIVTHSDRVAQDADRVLALRDGQVQP
jgi:putative ABC transport system ATP-binding protein